MEWAGADEVVIQQLNRRQDTNIVMLGDASSGKVAADTHRKRRSLGGHCLG